MIGDEGERRKRFGVTGVMIIMLLEIVEEMVGALAPDIHSMK